MKKVNNITADRFIPLQNPVDSYQMYNANIVVIIRRTNIIVRTTTIDNAYKICKLSFQSSHCKKIYFINNQAILTM